MKTSRGKSIVVVLITTLFSVSVIPAKADAATADPAASDPTADVAKVVWHADFADPRRFSAMLTSIFNMVNTFEQSLQDHDVRVVFNAHGIRFLTDDKLKGTPFEEDAAMKERREDLKNRLRSLQDTYDVKLELCEITREQVGLDKKKVYEDVLSVRSGVVRIAELQRKGFAYIKVE